MYVHCLLQRLLLLPELSGIAITNCNSEPVKETSRLHVTNMTCTHKLANKKTQCDTTHGLLSNDITTARIVVSGLTASWTNVNTYYAYIKYHIASGKFGEKFGKFSLRASGAKYD